MRSTVLLLVVACGTAAEPPPLDNGPALEPTNEPTSDRDPACTASWVEGVGGTIVGADGVALEGAAVQMCITTWPDGVTTCLRPEFTEADGSFTHRLARSARCLDRAVLRARIPEPGWATS